VDEGPHCGRRETKSHPAVLPPRVDVTIGGDIGADESGRSGVADDIDEVADNVFLAAGTDVNWIVLRDGADLTLIDSGWPGDTAAVEASIRAIGNRPEDVRAILLTHAHIDHMGALNHFAERYGTPVYMDAVEVAHAKREYLEQAGPLAVVKNIWRPGVLPWSVRVARVGALQKITTPHARPFPSAGALDLPGRPTPIATHGHTSGHSAYYLTDVGAVVTGDGLVTGHPTSRTVGPQVLPPMFNHSAADALRALDPLETLSGDLILPGHGRSHRGAIGPAVTRARELALG
jgi:glyoxylase-like metal-dependent hydrolase (beta-lactamase superfamily II)